MSMYIQKFGPVKAARVSPNQRFRLSAKIPGSVMVLTDLCANAKKIVASTRITVKALRCSGISTSHHIVSLKMEDHFIPGKKTF